MNTPAYILAKRQGSKWLAIAGTNSGGCLAASETVFSFHGLLALGSVHWGSTLAKQKNFAGYAPDYREVELSDEARELHWFKEAIAAPHYKSLAHFLSTFPEAARFTAELSALKP